MIFVSIHVRYIRKIAHCMYAATLTFKCWHCGKDRFVYYCSFHVFITMTPVWSFGLKYNLINNQPADATEEISGFLRADLES